MPLLNQSDIQQIIGEITTQAEEDKRQTFRRRGRIYKDGGKDFLIAHIEKEFGQKAVDEMRFAPVNALKSWIDRKSIIYAHPAIRITDKKEDQALIDAYVDMMGMDVIMQKANRYFNLYSNTELYVIPKVQNGFRVPWVNVIPPFLYSVSTSLMDRTTKDVIVFSSFDQKDTGLEQKESKQVSHIATGKQYKSEGDLIDSKEATIGNANTYIFWTEEQHFTTDGEGAVFRDPMNPEFINPIGEIPSVTLRKEVDNEFWAMQGEDMVDMAMAVQLGYTDLLSIAKNQGFSILTITSAEKPQRIEIGLNKVVWLKQKPDEPVPSIGYVQASSPISEYTSLLDRVLEISSTSNLLPANIFGKSGGGGDSTSGIQEMMKSAATMMEIESQKPVLRDAETSAWMLIAKWHNLLHEKGELPPDLQSLGTFSDEFNPNVIYKDMKPVESEEQRINQVERLLDRGLISKMDAFKKLFPELTDEQIKEKIAEIESEKEANAARFGLPVMNQEDPDQEQEEEEEDTESEEDGQTS